MATAIEKARTNAGRAPAAPSRASLAQLSRVATWTRRQEDSLLIAFEDGKTGQALADAVGDGRSVTDCEAKLKKLMPPLHLAYPWDKSNPRNHTAKIRALLPAEEQNLSKKELKKLWTKESASFRKEAIKHVVNVALPDGWNNAGSSLDILVLMALPPKAFRMKPKLKMRLSNHFKRHSEGILPKFMNARKNRAAREDMLAGEPHQKPYASLNPDGTRLDANCYREMRTKASCLVAISLGANPSTEMPCVHDVAEIKTM